MCVCVFVDSYTVYKKWFLVSTGKKQANPNPALVIIAPTLIITPPTLVLAFMSTCYTLMR